MLRLMRLAAVVAFAALAVCGAAATAAGAAPSAPQASDTHLAYVGSGDPVKAKYGSGDYVFDTVRFSGSKLPGNSVLSVGDLESLAIDGSLGLGYENRYSLMTSGAVFSTSTFSGIRLYDLLVRLGLDASAASSTPVRVYAADGYCVTLTLAQVKESSRYACYAAKGDSTVVEANVPVLLSFAVQSLPLIGPTGDDPMTRVFTAEDGYDEVVDNCGGPVRLTIGQTSVDDFNARFNTKWVSRVVVGDDTEPAHTGTYAALGASTITVNVYDSEGSADPLKTVSCTAADVEASSSSLTALGYYDDGAGAFYEGVDLWAFLSRTIGLPGHEGTATLTTATGETATVDLAYLRNLGRHHDAYTVSRAATLPGGATAALTITDAHPVLAFAKNAYPMVRSAGDAGYVLTGVAGAVVDNDGGPLAVLLPRDGEHLASGIFLSDVTRVDVTVDVPDDIHVGDVYGRLAGTQVSFAGAGLGGSKVMTVGDLETLIELMVTYDYGAVSTTTGCISCHELSGLPAADHSAAAADGSDCLSCHDLATVSGVHGNALQDVSIGASGSYHGIDLLQLLKSSAVDLAVDAETITVVGADGSSAAFSVDDLENAATPVLLGFSRSDKPLVESAASSGYDPAAGNDGGPLMLVSRRFTVEQVTSISVSRAAGTWTHAAAPYSRYLRRALTISGSEVDGTTILSLADLEDLDFVRDSFAASKGVSAYQGVVLHDLIAGCLETGLSRPTRIAVYGADGYSAELSVADVFDGIESMYQPGEHRDVILAYSTNGYPLVTSATSDGYMAGAFNDGGPLHLIVENSISSWVKDARAIVVGEGEPVYAADRVAARAVVITSPTAGQSRAHVARGARLRLRAVLWPRSSTDALAWSSSDRGCVSVSAKGRLVARSRGVAVITVKTSSGRRDRLTVVVGRKKAATAVGLVRRRTLAPGQATRLVARLAPAGATSLIAWRSSKRSVATVDSGGRVVALRRGVATITVRTQNGKRATCRVIVRGTRTDRGG